MDAGNDVLSGAYYVGRGTGMIHAGGSVTSDATLFQTLQGNSNFPSLMAPGGVNSTEFSVPLLLAVQDGFIGVQASGSIDLGGIFQPTQILADLTRNLVPGTFTQAEAAGRFHPRSALRSTATDRAAGSRC